MTTTSTPEPVKKLELAPLESHPKVHEKIEDMLSCPDCGKANRAKAIQLEKQLRETKPFVCETCKTGVDENEEACPLCGGKHAKPR